LDSDFVFFARRRITFLDPVCGTDFANMRDAGSDFAASGFALIAAMLASSADKPEMTLSNMPMTPSMLGGPPRFPSGSLLEARHDFRQGRWNQDRSIR